MAAETSSRRLTTAPRSPTVVLHLLVLQLNSKSFHTSTTSLKSFRKSWWWEQIRLLSANIISETRFETRGVTDERGWGGWGGSLWVSPGFYRTSMRTKQNISPGLVAFSRVAAPQRLCCRSTETVPWVPTTAPPRHLMFDFLNHIKVNFQPSALSWFRSWTLFTYFSKSF